MTLAKLFKPLLTLMGIGFLAVSAFSQTKTLVLPKTTPIPPPGQINLLEGYVYERRQGIDSYVGAIKRKDGFEITHDIGTMAGNYAARYFQKNQPEVKWTNFQNVGSDVLMLALLNDGSIIATFSRSKANFIAQTKSQEDVVQFLLIVMTYQPSVPKVTVPPNKR